jgi:hypothetical protein
MSELVNSLSRLQDLVERLDHSVMSNWPDEAGNAFRRAEVVKIQELIDTHRLSASIFEQSMHDLQQTAQ